MPALVAKSSSGESSPKGKKGVSKEYGGSDSGGGGGSGNDHTRRKKRSFLQRAKRFGDQGRHGKGSQVDGETYSYFVRILELLRKDDFETEEERETMVENALSMADGNEVHLSSNQLVSRVVENMLPFASEERLMSFCQALSPSLRVIVADAFASHVLEKLLELTSSDKWRSSKKLTDWFEKTAMFVLNNFEDFTFDTYGSFVTKKVLECLSGHLDPPNEQDMLGKKGTKQRLLQLALFGDRMRVDKWEKILQDFAKRFAAWPQFNDLGQRVETSRLLQNVIQTVSRTQNSQGVANELISRVLETLPDSLEPDNVAHRTLEVALSAADEKMYATIFNKYYKGNLVQYIHGPCFTLLKLISETPNQKFFSAIFDELSPSIKTVVAEGRTSVLHNLASQCVKYNIKQKEFWKLIKDAFKSLKDSSGEKNLIMKIVTLKPKGEKTEDTARFSTTYFGSSTVQSLMDFNPVLASEFWKSFEELKTPELTKLALDPKASFIVSKIFKSWNVPQEQKENLLVKLQDSLVELCVTKFGSRILDLIWLWADVAQKTTVATILSQRIPLLSSNKYSRFHVETMGLQALARNKKEWTEHIISQEKHKKGANKIAEELGITSPKKSNEDLEAGKKSKKRKSEPQVPVVEPETPKKKKKSRKSEVETAESISPENEPELETPKKSKKKKNKKSDEQQMELDDIKVEAEDSEESPKKSKRKSRKSKVKSEDDDDTFHVAIEHANADALETPNKSKKKHRKSQSKDSEMKPEIPEVNTEEKVKTKKKKGSRTDSSIDDSVVEEKESPKKKKKHRKSELKDFNVSVDETAESESIETPKKKKKKNKSKE